MINRLAVDVGNSRISLGLFKEGELKKISHHQIADAGRAIEEISTLCNETEPCQVVLSSVVPSVRVSLINQLRERGHNVFEVNRDRQSAVADTYPAMGTDRIANAAAAIKRYVRNCAAVVLDLGTATTLTAVDKEGRFAGGFITLGLGQTLAALHKSTEQLPDLQDAHIGQTSNELAFDTDDAIARGCRLGHIGMLQYWVKQAKEQLGSETVIVATGGYSRFLCPQPEFIDHIDINLTLYGIYLIAAAATDLEPV